MSESKTIGIGSDHAGYAYKEALKSHLEGKGYAVRDFGTDSEDSTDYPDYVHPLAQAVNAGELETGVLVCGSGNGVCMTANKYPNVRAALVWDPDISSLARLHNNANVICIPQRFTQEAEALHYVDIFLATEFEGGRHQRRVSKIAPAQEA